MSDNTTAIAYINKKGDWSKLAKEICLSFAKRDLHVSTPHILGKKYRGR